MTMSQPGTGLPVPPDECDVATAWWVDLLHDLLLAYPGVTEHLDVDDDVRGLMVDTVYSDMSHARDRLGTLPERGGFFEALSAARDPITSAPSTVESAHAWLRVLTPRLGEPASSQNERNLWVQDYRTDVDQVVTSYSRTLTTQVLLPAVLLHTLGVSATDARAALHLTQFWLRESDTWHDPAHTGTPDGHTPADGPRDRCEPCLSAQPDPFTDPRLALLSQYAVITRPRSLWHLLAYVRNAPDYDTAELAVLAGLTVTQTADQWAACRTDAPGQVSLRVAEWRHQLETLVALDVNGAATWRPATH